VNGEWRQTTIGKLIREFGGSVKTGPFGTTLKAAEYSEVGVPLISVGEVGAGRIVLHEKTPRVSPEVTARLSEYLLLEGDIVFGRKGAVERSARVIAAQSGWFLGSDGIRLRLSPTVDAQFISYCFQTKSHKSWMLQNCTGTTMPSLNQGVVERIPIPLPPLEIQKKIASILGALDDKIELNRRMNATLETIAQTLFKSWFVDFDPVKAKAAGLEPEGLDADTAVLFPSSFQTSSQQEIPEGWTVAELSEICEINPTRKLPRIGLAPYLDMGNMPIKGSRAIDWYDREIGSGAKFINGDTLFARITPCLENGKTAYVDFLENGQVGWGSTEYIVMRPKHPFPLQYAYILARDENFRSHAVQSMTGSSGRQRASAEALGRYSIAIPTTAILEKYGEILNSFFEIIKSRDEESKVLATTRDSLLPKLLSGEVDAARIDV
jgi:type I restriction enzyme, S subunit